jgi:hypothetical protein
MSICNGVNIRIKERVERLERFERFELWMAARRLHEEAVIFENSIL